MILTYIKKKLPANVKEFIRNRFSFLFNIRTRHEIKKIQDSQINIVNDLQKKEKLNVIFLVIHDSVWKYEEVYSLLDKDPKFKVTVVVIPLVREWQGQMDVYNQTLNYFIDSGYNTVSSYDEKKNSWLDIKSITNPDIVFFTNPHRLTYNKYYIDNFTDKLTCYAQYNFGNSHLLQIMHNQRFHNMLSAFYAETEIHKSYSEEYAANKGINVITTGYPGTDIFLKDDYFPKDEWKIKDKKIKRVIWAPHHTIDNNKSFLSYSSFLNLHEFMIKLLIEYNDKIQIAFKPHPLLKEKLYNEEMWGKERTDRYYNTWNTLSNGQLVLGPYSDLFLTSDGMIHDSGSFLIEYLYTSKPVLHTNRDENVSDRMNSFGIKSFNQHYHAKSVNDIVQFIDNVILKGNDHMKKNREDFKKSYLLPPNNVSASQNIYKNLKNQLTYLG